MDKTIVVASTNEGKLREFREMLEPEGYKVLSLRDLDHPFDIAENGTTFQENAVIKAQSVADEFNIPALADDSGLCIACLNDEPGVHSARWLGHDTPYDIKNQKVLELVKDAENRSCYYACAIAWCVPGKAPVVFFDTWHGEIAQEPKGENGFGYDPIIYMPEYGKTVAEMSKEEKNAVSHRAKALRKLEDWLREKH